MEELHKFLEEKFIPNNVYYKRVEDNNGERYIAKIPLTRIIKLKRSEEEKQYIIDYLKNKNIQVIGYSSFDDYEFDNYLHTRQYKKRAPKNITVEETMEKLKLYYDTKDLKIRNEIVLGNMRLVNYALTNMNRKYDIDIADLEQAGYIGLINAIDNYDTSKGAFSTFAISYINNTIKMALYELNGFEQAEYAFYIMQKKIEYEYGEKVINNPSLAKVIASNLTKNGFRNVKYEDDNVRRVLLKNPVSLDELSEEDTVYPIGYETLDSDLNYCYDKEIRNILLEKLELLTKKQQDILKLRYGIDCDRERILKEISELYDVSIAAIYQNVNTSLKKLREDEQVQGLKYYLHREI